MAIRRGVFAEDADEVTDFFARVVEQLAPVGPLEEIEARAIAALYVRRGRLLAIESEALASSSEPKDRHNDSGDGDRLAVPAL